PLPALPARAASMVALSASRLVCSAIEVISLTTSPMRTADCDSSATRPLVISACFTASPAIRLDSSAWRPISETEPDSSSAAGAARPNLHVARRLSGRRGAAGRQLSRLLGGVRESPRRGSQLAGGRRARVDDLPDRLLEAVRQAPPLRLALLDRLYLGRGARLL